MYKIIRIIILVFTCSFVAISQEINSNDINSKIESLELRYEELLIRSASIDSELQNKFDELISKDKELLRNFYQLNLKIKKNIDSLNSLEGTVSNIQNDLATNSKRLKELNVLLTDIEINYSVLNNALKTNSELIESMNDDISFLELSYDIVHKEYKIMSDDLDLQKRRLDSIPDLYFCNECLPNFNIQINWGVIPSNLYYIEAKSNIEALASIRLQSRLHLDLSYQMVSLNTISEPMLMEFNNDVLDKWDLGIISAGIKYNIKDPVGRKFNAEALIGGIVGFGSNDPFFNQQNVERVVIDFQTYYGIYTGINFVYSEISEKLPLEIVLGLKSIISFQEIVFDAGVNDPINIGNFMPQASFGIRYNFNFKK